MCRRENRQKESRIAVDAVFCAVTAFILIFFCSRSSPRYAINNWDDTNSYFTIGRAILHGKVPYRDLFDQKGYLFYFIYALSACISEKSFAGVFLMEWAEAFAALLAMDLLEQLYISPILSRIFIPVLGALIYSARCFWWGGSAEECMLPFLLWGLYLVMRYYHRDYPEKQASYRMILIGGILAGCIANIKFNSLGFYFAWMALLFFAELFRGKAAGTFGKRFVTGLKECLVFLFGMAVTFLPGLIYFGVHHAVADWFTVYIYDNIFIYSESRSLGERLYTIYRILINHFLGNPLLFTVIGLGCLGFLFLKVKAVEKWNLVLSAGFLILGIFIGNVDLPYYPLPLSMFSVFAGIVLGRMLTFFWNRKPERSGPGRKARAAGWIACAVSLGLSVCMVLSLSMNIYFAKYKREDLWMYQFADYIQSTGIENPTLINVGCFDAGLYFTAGITPTCRFFQTQTIHLDAVSEEQSASIRNGETDFVVTRDASPDSIHQKYDLVCSGELDGHTYLLYQRR